MLPNSICAGALIAILAVISIDRNPEDESDASMKLTGMRSTPACRQGFTLLELLVVMVIIGLLAAYVGPRYFAQIGKSEQGAARAQIESFAKALDAYRLDIGRYPTTDQGLDALVVKPGDEPRWQGPYLQKAVPVDPWGRAYVYRAPVANGDFELMSFGKDGQPGGGGDNADVAYR
jgi:general secretion pathway protein G